MCGQGRQVRLRLSWASGWDWPLRSSLRAGRTFRSPSFASKGAFWSLQPLKKGFGYDWNKVPVTFEGSIWSGVVNSQSLLGSVKFCVSPAQNVVAHPCPKHATLSQSAATTLIIILVYHTGLLLRITLKMQKEVLWIPPNGTIEANTWVSREDPLFWWKSQRFEAPASNIHTFKLVISNPKQNTLQFID